MRRALTAPRVVAVLGLLVLALVTCLNGWGTFYTDIKPEVYIAPWETLRRSLSAWLSGPYLGSPNFNVGLAPVLLVTSGLRAIGLSPEWTFKVFHLLLWVLAAVGAARLAHALVPRRRRWVGVVTGVAYLANPYAVVGGSTLAIALPMALLPWLLLCVVRGVREPRAWWRWPSAFGLVVLAMSGMNVAVVPLLQLLPVPVVAVLVAREAGRPLRDAARFVALSAVTVVAVSLYWLVPAAAASGTGLQSVAASESLAGIAKVSSMVEVLRGLGIWTIYGRDDRGPWVPEFSSYVSNPGIAVLTMLWPVLAICCLVLLPRLARRVAVTLTAIGAVGMVGLFPASGSSPLGAALGWLLTHVPLLAAFRTTNKLGSVLTLGLALAIGLGLPTLARRLVRVPLVATATPALAATAVVAWVAPALVGNLYTSPMDVPGYWRTAAATLDARGHDSRVLLLPGQTRPDYRWSVERPDDVVSSLLTRDAVLPESTPNASAPGGNLLAALADVVATGSGGPTTVSRFASYLGASDVLLRHDVVWEKDGGSRPAHTSELLSKDAGLLGLANYGRPGQNTRSPANPPVSVEEALLPPLQLYGALDGRATVRAEALAGSRLVVGDAWSVPAMSAAGLLGDAIAFRYLAGLRDRDVAGALDAAGRVVLTDTNRRRAAITNRLVGDQGRLLGATEPLGTTRALWGAADQTTLVHDGASATASSEGGAFFDLPYAGPDNVLDADPGTAWLFGDFGRAPGMSLDVHLPAAQPVGRVTLQQVDRGNPHIDEVTVIAGSERRQVSLPDTGEVSVDLGGAQSDTVRVVVDSLRGGGFGLVGLGTVRVDGVAGMPVAQLPDTLTRAHERLSPAERRAFADRPLDVLLTRDLGGPDASDDSEAFLARDLSLPDDRTLRPGATVRLADAGPAASDRLAGYDTDFAFTASRTFFDRLAFRPSQAADDREDTAWLPGGQVGAAWWQVAGPERDVPDIRVTQGPGGGADPQLVSELAVVVDGVEVARRAIGTGETTIPVPSGLRGSVVRLEVAGLTGGIQGLPPRLSFDTGVTVTAAKTPRCVPVATVDGRGLFLRPADAATLAGPDAPGTAWVACGDLRLPAGPHQVRPVDGVTLDALTLRDVQGLRTDAPTAITEVRTSGSASRVVARIGPTTEPVVLLNGQSVDPRWTARVGSTDLGVPQVVDGYSAGWVLPPSDSSRTVTMVFGPQRASDIALGVSGVAAVVLLVLATWVRRRRPDEDAEENADVATREATAPTRSDPSGPEPTGRSRRTRLVLLALVPVLGGLSLGWGGLAGGLVAAAFALRPRVTARGVVVLGAVVVLAGGVAQVLLTRDTWGTVDADAIARSLWPHALASAGLVLALATALRALPADREPRADA